MPDITVNNWNDADGNPSGGTATGTGLSVTFQEGPINLNGINGCSVEDLLLVAVKRLAFYQDSKFACDENQRAIWNLNTALAQLESRTANRTERGVEGTNEL